MTVHYYADLLGYPNRIDLFRKAIQTAVKPGDRVLEVGTGLGTFGFFAVQAGAERVVAVERSPVIHLAETLALANGLSERMEFVRGSLPEVPIDGEFDVVIFEDFPTILVDASIFNLLTHVQDRLAPGGRMVPGAARLCLAPVGPSIVRRETFPHPDGGHDRWGIDWSVMRPFLSNTPRQVSLHPEDLQGEAVMGPRLPLHPVPRATDLRIEGSWEASKAGLVHGLAHWFDLEVLEGEWVSNEPRATAEPWGQWFLPLDPPLFVEAGQTVEARVWRDSQESGAPAWIGWECGAGDESRRGHEFKGVLLGPDDLPMDSNAFVPRGDADDAVGDATG